MTQGSVTVSWFSDVLCIWAYVAQPKLDRLMLLKASMVNLEPIFCLYKDEEHEIDHLVVFATPRLLGVLRKVPLGLLKGHVEELEGNLIRLEAGQLAEHPLVRKLVRATQEE